jgi:hypothetical protein
MRLLLERHHALAQLATLLRQKRTVDQHAVALHREQHFTHRHLDVFVDARQLGVDRDLRMQGVVDPHRDIDILGRVLGGAFHRHLLERNAIGALAGDVVVADRRQVEMPQREAAEVVRSRFEHVRLRQRVVRDPRASAHGWRRRAGRTEFCPNFCTKSRPATARRVADARDPAGRCASSARLECERRARLDRQDIPTIFAFMGSRLVVSVSIAVSSAFAIAASQRSSAASSCTVS